MDLEQAYSRASAGLRQKMKHSVELLRKAEKLALAYDAADGFFLAFSGGKDSQALYHMAQLSGVKFKAHFAPTSVDPPAVIRFIRKCYPDVEFLKLKESIYSIAVRKGLLPTRTVRWCCEELKEHTGAGKVTLIGIRKAESSRRKKRNEVEMSSHKFSGDMDGFEAWRKEKVIPSVANPDAIDSESVTGCIKGKDSLLVSPIIYWDDKDVWEFLNDVVRVEHCELYDRGYNRIGCICCPMSTYRQKLRGLRDFPQIKRNWIKAIKAIRRGGGISQRLYLVECTQQSKSNFQNRGGGQHRNYLDRCYPFSDSPSLVGTEEDRENKIAENIFDWWISGKAYDKWYAEKYLQGKFDFSANE